MVVQELMEGEDGMVVWMVVKPAEGRELVAGGVVVLRWMEVLRVDLEVELGRSSVEVTLLQDLQHIRWYSGREQ